MNILKQKRMCYSLYEENGKKILSVVCGSIGIFEKNVELSSDEFNKSISDEAYLDALASKIRGNPEDY